MVFFQSPQKMRHLIDVKVRHIIDAVYVDKNRESNGSKSNLTKLRHFIDAFIDIASVRHEARDHNC